MKPSPSPRIDYRAYSYLLDALTYLMSHDPRALVLKKLLDRALDLMAETYREARDRNDDPKRVEQMVAAGRELRSWQRAAEASHFPPSDARPLRAIMSSVKQFSGEDSELYEAVQDASRFHDEFGEKNAPADGSS